MWITGIKTTPLLVRNKVPYHWVHGVTYGAEVILVEVQTNDGISGYGECIGLQVRLASGHLLTLLLSTLWGKVFF